MQQVINIVNNKVDVVTKSGLSLTEVSSETQIKNGTRILSLKYQDKEWLFGSYKSGYIRKLPSKSQRMDRLYQINKVKTYPKNYYYGGRVYPGTFHSRILVPDALDRLQYIMDFVDRNFGYYFLPSGYIDLVSLKEKRDLEKNTTVQPLQTS